MRSYSPQWLWRCRSRGYRQLCSLWFEYDLCLNGKPPNDLESCLTTLIRIRSTSVPKGVEPWFKHDQEKFPNELGNLPIKWVSTAMSSLVRIRPMFEQEAPKWPLLPTARFECDHKPDSPSSYHVILQWKQHVHIWRRKKDRCPVLLLVIIYIQRRSMYIMRAGGSSVVRPEMGNIPRPAGLLLRLTWVCMLSNVNEVIWPIV